MASPILFRNILVIEDQHLMRLALVRELQTAIPGSVIHAVPSLEIALNLIKAIGFELIFVDPGLPSHEPASSDHRLKIMTTLIKRSPSAIHVVVSGTGSKKEWNLFRKLGVAGYIVKNNLRPRSIGAILREIAEHGSSVGLLRQGGPELEIYHAALSGREQEVLAWMQKTSEGISRKEAYEQLAGQMNIDPASAERYHKRAKAKLLKYGELRDVAGNKNGPAEAEPFQTRL